MRLKHALLLSGSLILASCGMQAAPTAPTPTAPTQAQSLTPATGAKTPTAQKPAVQPSVQPSVTLESAALQGQALADPVFKLVFPEDVKFVTLEAVGSKGTRVFSAEVVGGQVKVTLANLPKGDPKYTLTVRAYDEKGGVVLYKSSAEVNFASGKITGDLTPQRVKADVTVTAGPLLPETTTLSAKLGEESQPMTITGDAASTVFKAVASASGLTVSVTGTSSDGQVTQTGTATFDHSEGGSQVKVVLNTVAHCPVSPTPVTAIPAIQGSGDSSPLLGQTVTVRGVVTADFQAGLRGFFVQARDGGDGDAGTSDGVFVYTGNASQAVKVGDLVQFTGTVKEFYGSTQVDTLSAFVTCASGLSVNPVELKAPFTDLEKYEGMRVTFPETLTVTDNYGYGRYGELGLSSGGRLFNPTNGNESTTPEANAARKIVLDDANTTQNPANLPYLSAAGTRRTGDTVANLSGVLHYANNVFKVEPTAAPTFTDANPRPAAPEPVGGTLKVAGANVLNYFTTLGGQNDRGADSTFEFQRQQTKIVNALRGLDADIVTLMEVQNSGDTALNSLVTALNSAYGSEVYRGVQTGTIGTDAIKVAIIYKPARVTPVGSYVIDNDPIHSRPPLAQTFQDKGTGGVLTVVANHFKSKGSCPSTGDVDTGEGCWNTLRTGQATRLLTFVDQLKTRSGDQDVLLMGDFNAYGQEKPIQTIMAGGFVSENLRIPAQERYSYQFGGLFGYLDHALASTSLDQQVTGVTEWHINADEPTLADYNAEYKKLPECTTSTCTSPDLWQNNPYRASDHDPVLVGLNLNRDEVKPTFGVTLSGADSVSAGQPYTLSIASSETPGTVSVNWGDGSTETLAGTATSAQHAFAVAGTFSVTVTAEANGQTATAQKIVTVTPLVVTPPPPTGSDLIISEYVEGSSNNKAIELYNPTSGALDLSKYSLELYSNGSATAGNIQKLSGTLNAGATLVFVNGSASAALKALGTVSAVTNFNGDDALVLRKDGAVIDVFGQVGVATKWGENVTLRRKLSVIVGDNNPADAFVPATEWDSHPIDTFDGLGTR
ncbi:ExeM/NucH family extracellular endonuclease [Deinococcus fonticola]|uniref:ExeM/NucH family extracellular endonuclease n=1 Tax=Deinococcus fonticola TaxID=2528713 RepID=UPI001074E799|nr:ExeM/NucH family extracellular endonuclease [Deinococcus fonticola]